MVQDTTGRIQDSEVGLHDSDGIEVQDNADRPSRYWLLGLQDIS